ncbi:MAG: hypothetical protein R2746_01155 [Acidimicrobiales bacterium]
MVITVLGADQVNPYDIVSINAASAAADALRPPLRGPIGAIRLAYSQDGQWIPHPTFEEQERAPSRS